MSEKIIESCQKYKCPGCGTIVDKFNICLLQVLRCYNRTLRIPSHLAYPCPKCRYEFLLDARNEI